MAEQPKVEIRKLTDVQPDPQNANRHKLRGAKTVERSLRNRGFFRPTAAFGKGVEAPVMGAGNLTQEMALSIGMDEAIFIYTDGTRPIVHVRTDIEPGSKEAQALAIEDNRANELSLDWNAEVLVQMPPDVLENLWTTEELSELGDAWEAAQDESANAGSTDEADEEEAELTRYDVPDALWPTDSEWGIPLLNEHLQANAVDLPVIAWGSKQNARKLKNPGTWHFYTEDYRFAALWNDPSPVVNSGCVNVVEPNFSCYTDMPPAVALYRIYQKRWLARWWQSQGVRVFVDLNVAEPHYQLNLLGVPPGWRAWATRGYVERLENTVKEYELACERAGTTDILFLVYGGGKAVRELCQQRGWVHVIEQRDAAKQKDGDNG